MTPKHINDDAFQAEVIQSKTPVLVDFWAPWCGPCKVVAPVLDELAQEFADKLVVAKVNIDENPDSPNQYGVRGIPTLLLFRNGEVIAQKIGAAPKQALVAWLNESLDAPGA